MDIYNEEDISELEDKPLDRETTFSNIVVSNIGKEDITPGTPVYRLRLSYSHETFQAIYRGGSLNPHVMVIVPTRYGKDLAQVIGLVRGTHDVSELAMIERLASEEDMAKAKSNQAMEKDASKVFKEKTEKHQLGMKLVHVHFLLEEPKILFFFTADNRVDFRDLVKDLAAVFKSRIELRQIGVRDEARVLCGLGICGRGYCCHTVSDKLKPVSIKMAKEQNLSFNSMKISGPCGRLLCCLSYEQTFYSEQMRRYPQVFARVSYENTTWNVTEVNLITGMIKMSDAEGRIVALHGDSFELIDNRWHVKA